MSNAVYRQSGEFTVTLKEEFFGTARKHRIGYDKRWFGLTICRTFGAQLSLFGWTTPLRTWLLWISALRAWVVVQTATESNAAVARS